MAGPHTVKLAACFAILLLASLFGGSAANAVVVLSCSVETGGLAFSPYSTVSKTAVDGAGTISVTCTGSGTETLSLNLIGGNTGGCSSRELRSGSATLSYQVYRDSGRTANFCDGGNRLDISFDFSVLATQTKTFAMYGRVFAGQNPGVGTYSDTLGVILKRGGDTLATTTGSMSASVAPSCAVSAGSLGFGAYSGSADALSAAGVSLNCSNQLPYQIGLAGGLNLAGASRRMIGPGESFLSYQLFSDAARTAPWGDGSATGSIVGGTGTGNVQDLTVYGRIPQGQRPIPGSYSDVVVVTVSY